MMGKLSVFIGGFFAVLALRWILNLAKAQIPQPSWRVIPISLFFVWRQWEFAFFGALTHVGALFYFLWRKKQ